MLYSKIKKNFIPLILMIVMCCLINAKAVYADEPAIINNFKMNYSEETEYIDTFAWIFSWDAVEEADYYILYFYNDDLEDGQAFSSSSDVIDVISETSYSIPFSVIEGIIKGYSSRYYYSNVVVRAYKNTYNENLGQNLSQEIARSEKKNVQSFQDFMQYNVAHNLYTADKITQLIKEALNSRENYYVYKEYDMFVADDVRENYNVSEEIFSIDSNQLDCPKDGGDYARIEGYNTGSICLTLSDSVVGKDGNNYFYTYKDSVEGYSLCKLKIKPFYTTSVDQEKQLTKDIETLCSSGELSECKIMSTVEKIKTCQKWVENHVTYSSKGNSDKYYLTAHAAYYEKASDCRGYALLFYRLLREFDIPVRVVETGSHIWNIVYVDGSWYSCDASAESGIFLKGSNSISMSNVVNKDFFLNEESEGFAQIIQSVSKTDHPSSSTYSSVTKANESQSTANSVTEANESESTAHIHSVETYTVSSKATLSKDGQKKGVCSVCKETVTVPISKIGKIKLSKTKFTYNKKKHVPKVSVYNSEGTLIDSSNYKITCKTSKGKKIASPKKKGKYKLIVTFKGSYYSGSKTLNFRIK